MTVSIEERVRALCGAFPEVTERQSHGAAAFFVGKQFVMVWPDGHHDQRFPHLGAPLAPEHNTTWWSPPRNTSSALPTSDLGAGWGCASMAKWTGTRSRCSARTRTVPSPPNG